MTKYQIFSPNGQKAFIIEADFKVTVIGLYTVFYKWSGHEKGDPVDELKKWDTPNHYYNFGESFMDIPNGWVAVPIECIVKEEKLC